MLDLGTLGGSCSFAYGINNKGQVVGQADTGLPDPSGRWSSQVHACLWNGGAISGLATLGGNRSCAYGINDVGQIVGDSAIPGACDASGWRAFLWQNGSVANLGTPSYPWGDQGSHACAINNAGVVAGYGVGGSWGAWMNCPQVWSNGQWTNLTYNYEHAAASAINNLGEVAGWYTYYIGYSNNTQTDGFLWKNGTMVNLPTLGGNFVQPCGINDAGQVVGYSSTSTGTLGAFLWTNGTIQNLNDLISANSGWTLYWANDINNSGQIVGTGVAPNREFHGFLLTPAQSLLIGNLYLRSASISNVGEFGLTNRGVDPLDGYDHPGLMDKLSLRFGNNIETQSGWRRVEEHDEFGLDILKGQWSRQGHPVILSRVKLFGETIETNPWNQRTLETINDGTVMIQGLTGSGLVPLHVRLEYDTQINGDALEDDAMIMVNWCFDSAQAAGEGIASGGLAPLFKHYAKDVAQNTLGKIGRLLDNGVQWVPEQSRFQTSSEAVLSLKQNGPFFMLEPPPIAEGVEFTLPGGLPIETTGRFFQWRQHRVTEGFVDVSPNQLIEITLRLQTEASSRGGAQAYMGITGYRIQFDLPDSGAEPLIIERTDPLPQDWDVAGAYHKNLLLATVNTPELTTGPVSIAASLGTITPSVGDEMVILGNSEPAGFLMPLHIGEKDTDLGLRIASLISDATLTDRVGLQLVLFKGAEPYSIFDGTLKDLFVFSEGLGTAEMPYGALLTDVDIPLDPLLQGDGVLLVAFGNLDDLAPQASLGIDLLAPTPEPATLAMLVLGGVLVASRRFRGPAAH
jgi:probable HAF family extracellular repeat protein